MHRPLRVALAALIAAGAFGAPVAARCGAATELTHACCCAAPERTAAPPAAPAAATCCTSDPAPGPKPGPPAPESGCDCIVRAPVAPYEAPRALDTPSGHATAILVATDDGVRAPAAARLCKGAGHRVHAPPTLDPGPSRGPPPACSATPFIAI